MSETKGFGVEDVRRVASAMCDVMVAQMLRQLGRGLQLLREVTAVEPTAYVPRPCIDLMPCGCARIVSSTDPAILPLTQEGFRIACERQRARFVIAEPGDFVMGSPSRSGVLLDGSYPAVLGNVARFEVRHRADLLVLCKAPGGEVLV